MSNVQAFEERLRRQCEQIIELCTIELNTMDSVAERFPQKKPLDRESYLVCRSLHQRLLDSLNDPYGGVRRCIDEGLQIPRDFISDDIPDLMH
jgi:hypothetical protein